jgi:acyl-CoA thioesterase
MFIFDRDTALTQKDDFNFAGIISPDWSINGNPNGGYLTAFLAAAMQKKSDKKWPAIVTANFLTKCETKKLSTFVVETISTGKQLDRHQVSLIQDGTERTRAWATFMNEGNCDESANRYEKATPAIPARQDCLSYPAMPKYTLFNQVEILLAPSCAGWLQRKDLSPISEQKGWIKFKDNRPCDAISLLLLADSFAPPVLASHGMSAWVPTIEYSVNLRALPDTPWIKGIFQSRYLTCGIVEEDGELWDENGKLLAISRQIAQFRKF